MTSGGPTLCMTMVSGAVGYVGLVSVLPFRCMTVVSGFVSPGGATAVCGRATVAGVGCGGAVLPGGGASETS